MRVTWALLRCSHLGPTLAVSVFATLLAIGARRGGGSAWVGAAVLAGQLSVGWGNDWLDRDRDRAVGRLDKPLVAGSIADGTVQRAALVALGACVVLSLASGVRAAAAHLLAVGAAWSYDLGLKRTPLSVVPFAAAFGLLPAFVALGAPSSPLPPAWAVVAGALLGAASHFTNTLADFETDAATGVRGLPHRLGPLGSTVAAALLLGGGAAAVAVGAGPRLPSPAVVALVLAAALVLAVVAAGLAGRGRVAFRMTMATAGALVVAFVAVGL